MPDIRTSVSSRIHYRKMGAGPVMVLLHGFPENGNLWRYVWDELAAVFTLLIPDMPGSGDSAFEAETGMEGMAQVVKEVLDAEKVGFAVIAGHSMGGYVALAFARAYPAMVMGISLVHSTPVADDEEKKSNRMKSAELIKKGGKEAFVKQMVPNLFIDTFKQNNPLAVKGQVDEALKTGAEALVNYLDAMRLRADTRDIVKNADFPCQWIIGVGDNIMNYKKILIESHQSAINFVSFYQDCGHMSMIEAPGKLAEDLKAFGAYSYKLYHAIL